MSTETKMRLGKVAMGLSLGVTWALSIFVIGILAIWCDYAASFVTAMSTFYLGYNATLLGSLIGALWGFFDLFIFGFFAAFFYNCFSGHCCPYVKKDKDKD